MLSPSPPPPRQYIMKRMIMIKRPPHPHEIAMIAVLDKPPPGAGAGACVGCVGTWTLDTPLTPAKVESEAVFSTVTYAARSASVSNGAVMRSSDVIKAVEPTMLYFTV